MNFEESLKQLAADSLKIPSEQFEVEVCKKGASGRCLVRLKYPQGSLIGVGWSLARPDNDSFVYADQLLSRHQVKVPELLLHAPLYNNVNEYMGGLALIEDFGTKDLCSFSGSSWPIRKQLYKLAIDEVNKIHHIFYDNKMNLQPEFDSSLYFWEQKYFAEHYLGHALGLTHWRDFLNQPVMLNLAEDLASLPKSLVHRDFQSQNILIKGGSACLIDFQGLRLGLPEYDIASLLFDPYVDLCKDERKELLLYWQGEGKSSSDDMLIYKVACQRLMQALGAFANIGLNQGNSWYLKQIPRALSSLVYVLGKSGLTPQLDLTWQKVLS